MRCARVHGHIVLRIAHSRVINIRSNVIPNSHDGPVPGAGRSVVGTVRAGGYKIEYIGIPIYIIEYCAVATWPNFMAVVFGCVLPSRSDTNYHSTVGGRSDRADRCDAAYGRMYAPYAVRRVHSSPPPMPPPQSPVWSLRLSLRLSSRSPNSKLERRNNCLF
jgi:hypothetical protein